MTTLSRLRVSSREPHLQDLMYKFVLVDEASQATEPQTIAALCLAGEDARVACIGDQMQLHPTVVAPSVALAGLQTSLFERLTETQYDAVRHAAMRDLAGERGVALSRTMRTTRSLSPPRQRWWSAARRQSFGA